MATLLVIGGSGFFGKSILDMFQRGNLKPWRIDKLIAMSRNAEQLKYDVPELLSGDVELLSADITTAVSIPEAEYVIFAAASTDARNYLNAGERERANIQAGALNYCRLVRKKPKTIKTLFVSSGAVYGTQPPEISNIDETYQFNNPIDIPDGKRDYAEAKRDAELFIKKLGEDGYPVSIARCFTFVGKYLPRDRHFAIGNFIADGLASRSIEVKANHLVYRSYMYADDLVVWMIEILLNANLTCPVFNVGSDEAVTLPELADKIGNHFGVEVRCVEIATKEIDRYVPSIQKARDLLGLKLSVNLNQAIQLSVSSDV